MKLEWFIARRYLASRRGARFLSLITLISIGGIFVGVMALIIVTSVMNGLQTELRDKILGTNPHIWVTTYGASVRVDDWEAALREIREVEGVVGVAPFVNVEVGLRNQAGHAEAAVLRGLDPESPGPAVTEIVDRIRDGSLDFGPTESGHPPILVGRRLADNFGLFGGEVVQVISLRGIRVGPLGNLVPRIRQFEVTGRFDTGMYEFDSRYVYVPLEAAQDVGALDGAVTGLEVRVPDPGEAGVVGRRIVDTLGYPYRADDWMTMNAALFGALQLEKLAMEIILLLIVIVAAFNIISTLVMMVTDKTREIGILRSMGLTSWQIRRVFILQGVTIGVVGTALGTAGGLFVTWLLDRYEFIQIPPDVYFIDRLPVALNFVDIGIIVAASLTISLLATIYPAAQAARLTPVEAIRHD